jgi:hypothetical protein
MKTMNKTTPNVSFKLKPLSKQKEKFTNVNLFDRREREILQTLSKPIQKKNRAALYKPKPLNKAKNHGIYLTETDLDRMSTDTGTQSNTVYFRGSPVIPTDPTVYEGDVLRQFQIQDKDIDAEYERSSRNITQIDFKTNAINRKQESVKDFIDKTRELILMKYTSTIKKERTVRLKETYENEIESLNDTIKSLQLAKELFNDNFFVKFGEYVKHLSNQREIEKLKSAGLLEEIIQLKNEIAQIQAKIRKIEIDKSNVIRWLYLQIQMKEKLLTLPKHYLKTIEETEPSHKLHHEHENSDASSFTGNNSERTLKRRNTRKANTLKKLVTLDEEEKIRQYKQNVIYPTAQEFLAQFKKFEDENINLINTYNELVNELRYIHKERNELYIETKKEDDIKQNELDEKTKELEALKLRNRNLTKEIKDLMSQTNNQLVPNKNIVKFMNTTLPLSPKKNKFIIDNALLKKSLIKAKFFGKIYSLYKSTLEVTYSKAEVKQLLKKVNSSSESDMLLMLKNIEISVDGLFGLFQYYNKNQHLYSDLLRKIKNTIEKKHKFENAMRLKEQEMLKIKNLKEQIEERNNKVYYRNYRKIDNYYEYIIKKEKKQVKDDDYLKEPLFGDFMFDVLEDKKHI